MFSLLQNKLRESNRLLNKETAAFLYAPTKSYFSLTPEEQAIFWTNYCELVSEGQNPGIYEVIKNQKTLQLGFDLKLVYTRQQIPYKREEIENLVDTIDNYVRLVIGTTQNLIGSYFETTGQNYEYIACYLKRNKNNVLTWEDQKVEFIGRILFPYVRIEQSHISKITYLLRNDLQLRGKTPDNFLSIPPITGMDNFLTPIQEFRELYGSSKDDDTAPLKLYEIYGLLNGGNKVLLNLEQVFHPSYHPVFHSFPNMGQLVLNNKSLEHWLPLFFSIDFFNKPMSPRWGIVMADLEGPNLKLNDIYEGGETLSKLDRVQKLLTYISISRVQSEWSWLDLGQAIYSVDSGNEGFQLWKWITIQSDFKTEEDCRLQWNSFDPHSEITAETIEFFAAVDNPEQYENFRKPDLDKAIEKAINLPENIPVAEAFKAFFPYQFVCSSHANSEWYFYDKHRWVASDGIATLETWIIKEFQPKLEQIQLEITKEIAASRDLAFKSKKQSKLSMVCNLINKLSNITFLKKVCEALKIFYHNPNFDRIKDNIPYYMGVPNGVIDLRNGVAVVRPGKPQDYITRCARYPFPYDYTWDRLEVKMTLEYLHQVFRNKNLYNYFLGFSSSLLLSGNHSKIFPIFTGQGNNSKSMLVRLFEGAFGNYAVKLPTTLITGKPTDANAATPALIHAKGAKIGFLEEPNKREVIQSGTVKHLTGQDTKFVRDLFQKGSKITEMNVTFVPILIANKIPSIPDCQEAIWNRTRVLEFTSKWCKNAPSEPEEQFRQGIFQENKFFDKKIPMMAPAFLWILVQHYEKYYQEGLNEPPEVLQATENFRIQNNIYIHFTRDCLTQVLKDNGEPDERVSVSLKELFNAFKTWWIGQELPGKKPTMTEFKENLEITWKTKADGENKWYGLRLNTQRNEINAILSF